jgi:hypothetical protein
MKISLLNPQLCDNNVAFSEAQGKLLGPSVWALRLPSAISAIGLLLGLLMTVEQFGVRSPSVDDAKTQSDESRGGHYVPAVTTIAAFALNLEVSWCKLLITLLGLGFCCCKFICLYVGLLLEVISVVLA